MRNELSVSLASTRKDALEAELEVVVVKTEVEVA
jgi:hypothetical protein